MSLFSVLVVVVFPDRHTHLFSFSLLRRHELTRGEMFEQLDPTRILADFLMTNHSTLDRLSVSASHSLLFFISSPIPWTHEAALLLRALRFRSHAMFVEIDWEMRAFASEWGAPVSPPPSPPRLLVLPLQTSPVPSAAQSSSSSASLSTSGVSSSSVPAQRFTDVLLAVPNPPTEGWTMPLPETYGAAFPLLFNLFTRQRFLAWPTSVVRPSSLF